MSKHTPGEWKIICKNRCIGSGQTSIVTNGCASYDKPHISPAQTESEREANANLISAAPSLLRALKSILKEEFLHAHEGGSIGRGIYNRRIVAARKALAKAEGRTE